MENKQLTSWSQTTANLYKAVQLFTWCAIAGAVIDVIGGLSDVAEFAQSGSIGFGFWDILGIAATAGVVYGYWLFLQSIDIFKGLVNPADVEAVGKIRLSTLLTIIGSIVALFPVIGIAGNITVFVGWVILFLAYSTLKGSQTLPATAVKGVQKLYTATILCLIGWVVAFIPLLGAFATLILTVIAFFMTLKGWQIISTSEEPAK